MKRIIAALESIAASLETLAEIRRTEQNMAAAVLSAQREKTEDLEKKLLALISGMVPKRADPYQAIEVKK